MSSEYLFLISRLPTAKSSLHKSQRSVNCQNKQEKQNTVTGKKPKTQTNEEPLKIVFQNHAMSPVLDFFSMSTATLLGVLNQATVLSSVAAPFLNVLLILTKSECVVVNRRGEKAMSALTWWVTSIIHRQSFLWVSLCSKHRARMLPDHRTTWVMCRCHYSQLPIKARTIPGWVSSIT